MGGAKGYHAASEGSQGNHEGLGGSKMYHERPQRHGDEERRVRPHDLNQLLELREHLLVICSEPLVAACADRLLHLDRPVVLAP